MEQMIAKKDSNPCSLGYKEEMQLDAPMKTIKRICEGS